MNEETRRRRAAIAFCCLGLFLGASGDSVRAATTNLPHHKAPFRQLAVELQDRQVVALGDFDHQNAYPFHTVTLVLSNWLSLAATNGGQLTLALEADAEMAEVLRQYLKSGDLEIWSRCWSSGCHSARWTNWSSTPASATSTCGWRRPTSSCPRVSPATA